MDEIISVPPKKSRVKAYLLGLVFAIYIFVALFYVAMNMVNHNTYNSSDAVSLKPDSFSVVLVPGLLLTFIYLLALLIGKERKNDYRPEGAPYNSIENLSFFVVFLPLLLVVFDMAGHGLEGFGILIGLFIGLFVTPIASLAFLHARYNWPNRGYLKSVILPVIVTFGLPVIYLYVSSLISRR